MSAQQCRSGSLPGLLPHLGVLSLNNHTIVLPTTGPFSMLALPETASLWLFPTPTMVNFLTPKPLPLTVPQRFLSFGTLPSVVLVFMCVMSCWFVSLFRRSAPRADTTCFDALLYFQHLAQCLTHSICRIDELTNESAEQLDRNSVSSLCLWDQVNRRANKNSDF